MRETARKIEHRSPPDGDMLSFFHLVNRLEPLPLAIQKNDGYYYVRKTTQNVVLLSVPFSFLETLCPPIFRWWGRSQI